jgi:catalase
VNEILANIDLKLAAAVAENLGLPAPKAGTVKVKGSQLAESPALSQMNHPGKVGIKGRKIAVLIANGVDAASVDKMVKALEAQSARPMLLGPTSAPVKAADGTQLPVDASMEGMPSIMFDGIVVPAGKASTDAMAASGLAKHFLLEGYKHLKAMVLTQELLATLGLKEDKGLLTGDDQKAMDAFVKAVEGHRVWEREAAAEAVPA